MVGGLLGWIILGVFSNLVDSVIIHQSSEQPMLDHLTSGGEEKAPCNGSTACVLNETRYDFHVDECCVCSSLGQPL